MLMMYILENVPLAQHSTMRLGGIAAFMTDVNSRSEVIEAVQWADERGLPAMIIGHGGNIIWAYDD